jgi:hypothetical protein
MSPLVRLISKRISIVENTYPVRQQFRAHAFDCSATERISCQIPRFIALLPDTCFRTRKKTMASARFYFYFHFSYSSPRAVEKR